MRNVSTVMDVLIFLVCGLHLTAAGTYSLRYHYTAVTPGINFPEYTAVGQVDGEQFVYYDSKIRSYIPKTEWIRKIDDDEPHYWDSETRIARLEEQSFKASVAKVMQRFNQTQGVHTVQETYGCELDDDGTTRGYRQYGYDGEDFISLDLKTKTWTAAKPQAEVTKQQWESDVRYTDYWKNYLENTCIDWLKKYVSYGRETLERKDRPEALLFQMESSPEVVCHATGFFPKAVMITWQKDGEDVHEDVELRETLPNQDGSFQKRSILKVPAEELQKHEYTCVVQHSSLGEDIVLPVSRTMRDGGSDGAPIAIVVGVIITLVALVAVIAGIVVWKKKNSGFKPVPAKPSSEGDSSSNNS